MFDAKIETLERQRVTKYSLHRDGNAISFAEVIELWKSDVKFRAFFSGLLADSEFAGFRWETPALSVGNSKQAFEFVLLDASTFCKRKTDTRTYEEYFSSAETDQVVSFSNLRGDATLIVPTPQSNDDIYGHLASFVRGASSEQLDSFWKKVAETVLAKVSESPIWLNTAGGGVAWLHVRIDSTPKYYGHAPYRS